MQKITTSEGLKSAIQQLEYNQANEWPLLREQFITAYESFKPINIIKDTIKQAVTSPDIKANIVNAAIGLTSGFVAKKVFVANVKDHPFQKLLGIILEMLVVNKVANNADEIKAIGNVILKKAIKKYSDFEKAK